VVLELDGAAMQTYDGLFQQFADKLRFPAYFGRNWPALQDCLNDLTWIPPAKHYLITINQWPKVLTEYPADRQVLCRILNDTGETWARLGHDPDSGPVSFNTLLLG